MLQHPSETIAETIANGHGYKHVERGEFNGGKPRCGADIGVNNREEYQDLVQDVITSEHTSSFVRHDGGAVFYSEDRNVAVAYDPNDPDLGSCFRPTSKDRYVDTCLKRDNEDIQQSRQFEQGAHQQAPANQSQTISHEQRVQESKQVFMDQMNDKYQSQQQSSDLSHSNATTSDRSAASESSAEVSSMSHEDRVAASKAEFESRAQDQNLSPAPEAERGRGGIERE